MRVMSVATCSNIPFCNLMSSSHDIAVTLDSPAWDAATQRATPWPTAVPTVFPTIPSPTLAQTQWPSFAPSRLPTPSPSRVPSPSPSWPWLELRAVDGTLLHAENGEVTLTPTSQ